MPGPDEVVLSREIPKGVRHPLWLGVWGLCPQETFEGGWVGKRR